MGTDIHGWVEIRTGSGDNDPPYYSPWDGIINITPLIARGYDMFSSLFGVTTYAAFRPIAAHRGLPSDISEEASADYLQWDATLGETWIAWQEIVAIDWTEDALDSRPYGYRSDSKGNLIRTSKAVAQASDTLLENHAWQEDTTTDWVARIITRRDALSADWELLFRLMKELTRSYGEDKVRLVIWFDH